MITVKQLQYAYPQQTPIIFPDFVCKKGEQLLILGKSGCGKTTLLQLLAGMLPIQQGDVCINNTFIKTLKNSGLDDFRGKNMGFVFQQHHFFAALSVEENLFLAQQLAGVKTDKKVVNNLLERLNLSQKARAKANNLSQGEQQRVSIARALVHQPSVLLADEPSSALDDDNCHEVITLLKEQAAATQTTLLIVTHDARLKTQFGQNVLTL